MAYPIDPARGVPLARVVQRIGTAPGTVEMTDVVAETGELVERAHEEP